MNLVFWPYKMGSKGCKSLARGLGSKRVYADRKFKPKARHIIVNWGNSGLPNWWPLVIHRMVRVLNPPTAIVIASDKLNTFNRLSGRVPIPDFTASYDQAVEWAKESKVYCRKLLTGKGGNGIIVASSPDEVVDARLYTKAFPTEKEYRVHVVCGEVIDTVQKKKLTTDNLEERGIDFNSDIRNHDNGWIFARTDIEVSDTIKDTSISAVRGLGLDFGAVDIAEDAEGNVCVFEVNTAPGIEGTTLELHMEAFERKVL